MPEITYDAIQPMIEKTEQEGSMMKCSFACPASGQVIDASAALQKGKGVMDIAKASAQRNVLYSIRRAVSRSIRSVLGHNMLGRVGQDVANTLLASVDGNAKQSFSESEKQAAIVRAFEAVSGQFTYDGQNQRWVLARAAGALLGEFAKQLNDAPITERYDKGVLARMLVEVAHADGILGDDEKAFLSEFIPAELGTIEALAAKGPLSKVDLEETSTGARDTMLMLAWATAFCDEELADKEKDRIEQFATGLSIDNTRAGELVKAAQHFVVDQALESWLEGGKLPSDSRDRVLKVAKGVRLDQESAERAEIRFRKRHGLV